MNTPSPVPSPCVKQCVLDSRRVCVGCFRSLAEIKQWSEATEPVKREIMSNVAKRATNQSQSRNHGEDACRN